MAHDRPSSLHVDTEPHWGGGQQQVLHLLVGLAQRSLRAELVARPGCPLAERAASAGIVVHMLPLRGEWDVASALRLARIARTGGFDLLHLHTSHAHGLGRLASMLGAPGRIVVSRRVAFRLRGGIRTRLKYRRGVDRFIAISAAVRRQLLSAGIPPERVSVVPSGVDPARFDNVTPAPLREECGFPPDAPLVGVVGRLAHGKGQQDFLHAAAQVAEGHPAARFVLIGEGEARRELESQAQRLGIADRVAFTGFRADVPAVLRALDAFVMPSHAEGLCTSVIEAMLAGLPVVATNVGGIVEVVEDGVTGLLVPQADPRPLAEAIDRLLSDRALAAKFGAAGRERARSRFGVETMVEQTIHVYEFVVRGDRAAEPAFGSWWSNPR